MAQGTKCLHAIWNYIRKVKLKYQHVPPPTMPSLSFFLFTSCYDVLLD